MKQILTGIILLLGFASCKNEHKPVVSSTFIDSLFSHYSDTAVHQSIETEIRFWKDRINPSGSGLVSELRYASALVQRFKLNGDIHDIQTSDSILLAVDRAFNYKETGPKLALVHNYILQHRFKEADSVYQVAAGIGLRNYEKATNGFDVAFELGQYRLAETYLNSITDYNDFGFQFRKAKLAHYNGEIDTAINAMAMATALANESIALKQAALSNQADLNMHKGDLLHAAELYRQSIMLQPTDLHSIAGLGWIAMVDDKNDSLAEKIFRFIQTKTKAPDVLFKLMQVAEARGDTARQKKWATEFAAITGKTEYGLMYNKYLLELFTGILNEPGRAEALVKKELLNRSTPQTYAWVVWALFNNNKTDEAANIYKTHVSGKPLEGLELYWMGLYMQSLEKSYNANEYFKAAYKNRYDLGPSMQLYLGEQVAK